MHRDPLTRRNAIGMMAFGTPLLLSGTLLNQVAIAEEAADDAALMKRFDFLSQNTNVNCSAEFEASIATMPADARLQGSCCSPMDKARYLRQIKGIRKYAQLPEIPPDPYDIPASMAQKVMP